jgi:hypothetical protein
MRQIQVADLTASANEIDNRMGPIPGRSSDRRYRGHRDREASFVGPQAG